MVVVILMLMEMVMAMADDALGIVTFRRLSFPPRNTADRNLII